MESDIVVLVIMRRINKEITFGEIKPMTKICLQKNGDSETVIVLRKRDDSWVCLSINSSNLERQEKRLESFLLESFDGKITLCYDKFTIFHLMNRLTRQDLVGAISKTPIN